MFLEYILRNYRVVVINVVIFLRKMIIVKCLSLKRFWFIKKNNECLEVFKFLKRVIKRKIFYNVGILMNI